jgi:deoxycytidylate deaminase
MGAAEKQDNKKSLPIARHGSADTDRSRLVVRNNASNELIIAVVGHVGSGTGKVSALLKEKLEQQSMLVGGKRRQFEVKLFKASDVIKAWAERQGKPLRSYEPKELQRAIDLQNLGDEMRKGDTAAVARGLIQNIHAWRRQQLNGTGVDDLRLPDGQPRAYIIESLRHPAEIHLLRGIYQTAFAVIGVVCDEDRRYQRLFGEEAKHKSGKFSNVGGKDGWAFIERDRKAKEKYGQRVDDAFHLADYFVDNTPNQKNENGSENISWHVPDNLTRFIRILTHSEIERPEIAETAMYAAEGAKLRSACLSRQVGAALVDPSGNLIATGTNEVPRAGGGVYGQTQRGNQAQDHRCAYRENSGCSNTREQRAIGREILEALKNSSLAAESDVSKFLDEHGDQLMDVLRATRLGGLIEFSRAVHAEMDALLSAARQRLSPVGARMFVTTFPCHACARHLVAAGVDEVQYLEPYPKSKALDLHKDAIAITHENWKPPSEGGPHVLFRPFTGVAPRLYSRAFLKDRDLKDDHTGDQRIGDPSWGSPWELGRLSYVQLEEKLLDKSTDL